MMRRGILVFVLALFILPCFAEVKSRTDCYNNTTAFTMWNSGGKPNNENWAENLGRRNEWKTILKHCYLLDSKKNKEHAEAFIITLYTAPTKYEYCEVVAYVYYDDGREKKCGDESFYSYDEAWSYFNYLRGPYEYLLLMED